MSGLEIRTIQSESYVAALWGSSRRQTINDGVGSRLTRFMAAPARESFLESVVDLVLRPASDQVLKSLHWRTPCRRASSSRETLRQKSPPKVSPQRGALDLSS